MNSKHLILMQSTLVVILVVLFSLAIITGARAQHARPQHKVMHQNTHKTKTSEKQNKSDWAR